MKTIKIALAALLCFLLVACSTAAFMPGSPEQDAFRAEIQEQYEEGNISIEIRDAMFDLLDAVGTFAEQKGDIDWWGILLSILGVGTGGGALLGVRRASIAIRQRGAPKPLADEEIEALKQILRNKLKS